MRRRTAVNCLPGDRCLAQELLAEMQNQKDSQLLTVAPAVRRSRKVNQNFEDDWESDNPKEECGVFGIFAPGEEVARITFFGLFALQHRGQESAGIAVSDGQSIRIH